MHTVIARLVYRWVTVFLVIVLVGVLMAEALRGAQASDVATPPEPAARYDARDASLVANASTQ